MENNEYKILIVDDEPDILEFLSYNLKREGFHVETSTNGIDAIKKAKAIQPHLIILDIMMPEMDGIETCREIRMIQSMKNTIIIFLTARGEDYSQIAGLDAGADDYITKPIRPRVLISRIKAKLRRYDIIEQSDAIFKVGDITIDKDRYIVIQDDKEKLLAKKEFELLLLLTSKPNKVFSRDEIFTKIWGSNVVVGDRTIDVHVRKLREKLKLKNIKTIKGVGYKFEA